LGYHFPVEDHLMRLKALLKVAMGAALSLVTSSAMAQTPAVELKVGDMAPAFSAPGSDGKTHTLAESRGKQAVVLAWFPKAFTAG
jgi:thioredoxin-dependent peroxiredoxin